MLNAIFDIIRMLRFCDICRLILWKYSVHGNANNGGDEEGRGEDNDDTVDEALKSLVCARISEDVLGPENMNTVNQQLYKPLAASHTNLRPKGYQGRT